MKLVQTFVISCDSSCITNEMKNKINDIAQSSFYNLQ